AEGHPSQTRQAVHVGRRAPFTSESSNVVQMLPFGRRPEAHRQSILYLLADRGPTNHDPCHTQHLPWRHFGTRTHGQTQDVRDHQDKVYLEGPDGVHPALAWYLPQMSEKKEGR